MEGSAWEGSLCLKTRSSRSVSLSRIPTFAATLSIVFLFFLSSYAVVLRLPISGTRSPGDLPLMTSQDKGRPLPKFGEWDVNNPASAEGFTVIFNKARDDKKTSDAAPGPSPKRNDPYKRNESYDSPTKRKWLCCG